MGFVYIVTSIHFNNGTDGVKRIPNLGVHSSYKKALRHYHSVREDRRKSSGGLEVFGQCVANPRNYPLERETLLMSDHFPEEEIRLEKWKV